MPTPTWLTSAPLDEFSTTSRANRVTPNRLPPVAAIIDALPRAVIVVDSATIIIGWNVEAERTYGWTVGDAVGHSVYDLITPPELLEQGRAVMAGVLDGTPWTGDLRIVRKDGQQRITFSFLTPVHDDDGRVVAVVSAADDVTDVRRVERDASRTADHLLLALAAGHLGTWRWDRASGRSIWDEAMCRLYGFEPDEFDGRLETWSGRVHPDDAAATVAVVARAIEQKAAYATEHRVVWPDGSVHWVDARGKVVVDELADVVGTIGCATDITDRKVAEMAARQRADTAERLATDEYRQRARLEFLVELNDLVLHAVDHLDLMRRAAFAAVPRLGDWCTVHFAPQPGLHQIEVAHRDPAKVEWARAMRSHTPLDPEAPFGVPAVLRSGRTEFFAGVDRYLQDQDSLALDVEVPEDLLALVEVLRVTSIITVPMVTKRGVIGAMQFVTAESGARYDDDDVALAEAAAGRIAAALDNAWHSEQQRSIAATLQAALLPSQLPEIPGVEVAVRYWAAGAVSEVGGDFYDIFSIDERRWAVVIGDVCGTGADAAAITSAARHTIRAAASHGAEPADVLAWVNTAVRDVGGGRFCTVVYAVLEALPNGSWKATTVVGGHPLPVVVDADGSVRSLGAHGTLIGALDRIRLTTTEDILLPGTTVVMHTDGVNDVRPPHGLDDEALQAMVLAAVASTSSADEVADRMGDAIQTVLSIPERDDDVAIVVLRIS